MNSDTFEQVIVKFQETSSQFVSANAKVIDDAITLVAQHHDRRSIGPLLSSLDDGAQEDAGMFSLIHAAENFDDDTYVNELLAILPQLVTKAPKWASIVWMRGLNSENTRNIIVKKLREADLNVKQSAAWLCKKINDRSPLFLSKTIPILLAIKQ
ncbi:MAG: hypothetical protein KGM99_16375 [Burkholderiales bacterium]|nr:hypothetical protein [Burkholderiales bacterium]